MSDATGEPMNAADRWQRLMADPATPYWVRAVLDHVARLDPVDAANWLEVIADVAVQRADEVLAADLVMGSEEEREVKRSNINTYL